MNPGARLRSRAAAVGCAAFLIYLATTGGSLATTDAVVTYEVTRNLLRHGSTALTDGRMTEESMRGVDGRFYSPFGIGQSLYNIPFYLAGAAAARVTGVRIGGPETLPKAVVSLGSAFAAAGAVWVTCLFAWRVSDSGAAAIAAALCLAFASALWPYSKFGFSAPLAALCLTAGVYGVWLGATQSRIAPLAWGGAWLGFGLLTRHELALVVVPVLLWAAAGWERRSRLRALIALATGPAIALAVWLAYNASRFGDPLYAGHRPGFGASGFTGLLFSPGGSVFLYSPITLAALAALVMLWRRDRRTAILLSSVGAVLFVFYGSLADWLGTRSYGPRYLVPLLPLLCVPLAPALVAGSDRWRMAIRVAALAGVLVQIPGIMLDPGKVNVSLQRPGPVTPHERRYDWRLSALTLNTKAAAAQAGPNLRYVVGASEPEAVATAIAADEPLSQRLAFSLDFWWLYLFYLGVMPGAAAILAPAILAATAVWLTRRAYRNHGEHVA